MSRPRILVDVDGVLADFIGGALKIVNAMFGTSWAPADVTEFDFCKSLGLDDKQAADVKRMIGRSPGLARSLDVLPGAVEGMRELGAVAEVYIVTSPWNSNQTWTHDRETWLERHFAIRSRNIIHTSAKHVCAGYVLVDDKTETLEQWQSWHARGIAVQWQTPHNRLDAWRGRSTCSWTELTSMARRLSAGQPIRALPDNHNFDEGETHPALDGIAKGGDL